MKTILFLLVVLAVGFAGYQYYDLLQDHKSIEQSVDTFITSAIKSGSKDSDDLRYRLAEHLLYEEDLEVSADEIGVKVNRGDPPYKLAFSYSQDLDLVVLQKPVTFTVKIPAEGSWNPANFVKNAKKSASTLENRQKNSEKLIDTAFNK